MTIGQPRKASSNASLTGRSEVKYVYLEFSLASNLREKTQRMPEKALSQLYPRQQAQP